MPEDQPPKPRSRKLQLAAGVLLLAAVIWAAWFFTGGGFHDWVRRRVVVSLERTTGGRASISRLTWDLSAREFVAYDVTVRGREQADTAPYLHVDRLYLRFKIISLLHKQVRLEYLELDHPAINIFSYADGSTNQPVQVRNGASPEALFNLAIGRLEVHDGEVRFNNQAARISAAADGVRSLVTYNTNARRFDGTLDVEKLDANLQDMRPFSAAGHAEFSVQPDRVEVRSFRAASGASWLQGSATITDLRDPHLQVLFTGRLDLAQAALITRNPEVRGGTANLSGHGEYHAGTYSANGTLQVNGAAYHAGSTIINNLAAHAQFNLSDHQLAISAIHGAALGGSFAGEVRISSAAELQHRQLQGSAKLTFQGMALENLQRELPAAASLQFPARGVAEGSVNARWVGRPQNAVAELTVNIVPPAAAPPGEVPVGASVRGTYHAAERRFDIAELQLRTPASEVQATGAVGAHSSALKVSLSSSQFPELQATLGRLGIHFTLPVDIAGAVQFNGQVIGTMEEPAISGHIVINNFDYRAEFTTQALITASAPAAPREQAMRVHFDKLSGDLQYSARGIELRQATLENGKARIRLEGSATLADGHIVPTSKLDLQANIINEDVTRMGVLLGTTFPLTGTVSGSLRMSGAADNPSGNGEFRVASPSLWGEPGAIASSVSLREHELTFNDLEATRRHARVTGGATYNLLSKRYTFSLRGGPFELAEVAQLQSARLSVSGVATFDLRGAGTEPSPEVNGAVHISQLTLNGESVGNLDATARTEGGVMQLSASTTAETAQLNVRGMVQMGGAYAAQLNVSFPQLDFDPLLTTILKGRLTGHSLASGEAQVSGPLRSPRQLTIQGEAQQFFVAIENFDLRNAGPVRFHMANETFFVDSFHITGQDTDFSAAGSFPLAMARSMDFTANGKLDLRLIQSLNANLTSSGQVNLMLHARGTFQRPLLSGQVTVANGNLAHIELPNGLSDLNGTMVFDQNRLIFQQLTGHTGGGDLTLGGYVEYAGGLSFAVTGRATQMRLRYPPGVSAIANTTLRWTGTPKSSLLSGDILVTRFSMNPKFDFGLYIARTLQSSTFAPNSPLQGVRLDVHVVSSPELQVSTALAKVSGDMDLHIRGTLLDPVVLGRVNILRGTIYFNGTTYNLERGYISFLNPTTIEPVLNVEFSTRVAGYDINLGLDGPLDRLHTTYRSDPPLPSSDIISLLAFRQCPTSSQFTCSASAVEQAETYNPSANPSFTETASNEILGEALNETLSNRVQKLFGISRVKISPELASAIGNPSARITIEQQVSNKVTITYVTDVAQSTQQVIQMEYNISRSLSVVAVRDQFGVLSVDLRIRRRKR